ncbi:hypothetical protein F5890DRAFT_1422489 [Lentinula detonsa]|uniref:Uncharacterized protein n=1 Tax=Lentinula detonsa TaxID=2804962 RepID=A0AA38PMY9_9AGAR|nr:hypothetical protein F5890DRAFT_1422489 [Lentinula detonsa]
MRTCFLRITGQSTINGFAGYSPIDDQTVNNFGEGRGQGPDGVNARRLYFGTGWRRAAWNQQIVASIAETVVTEADGLQPMLSIDVVKAAIWDYVTQAQASWTAPKPRVHENGLRLENDDEAAIRQGKQLSRREKATRINCLKKEKYEFRRNGISALLGDPSQDQVTKRKWEMMAEINTALQIEGQSSEESDHDQDCPPNGSRPLKVSRPRYRHPVVSELMGHLDLAIGIHREHTARGSGKRLRAKHARIRIRTPTTSVRTVKSGLPRNLYDPVFLETLTPAMRAEVKPHDSEISQFSHYTAESNRMQE